MTRLFWTTLFFTVALGAISAQSTWRGQAELWQGASVPSTAAVAASNDFPRNSIVNIENYKTKKVVQVRIISGLPAGSSAFLLITSKVAADLGVVAGETPLVGVQVDTSVASAKGFASDEAINPDRDVNPVATVVAAAPKTVTPVVPVTTPKTTAPTPTPTPTVTPTPTPTPAPKAASPTPTPTVAAPAPTTVSVSPTAPAPTTAPSPEVLKPQVAATLARTGASTNPLDLTRSTTALDPDLVPLPALESPPAVTPPTVAITEADDDSAPVTPGRRVFLPVAGTDTVASEVPAVEEAPPVVADAPVVEAPTVETAPTVAVAPPKDVAPVADVPSVVEAPTVVEAPAVVEAPSPAKTALTSETAVTAAPTVTVVEKPAPVGESTPPATVAAPAVVVASVVAPAPAAATNWVSTPTGLTGPVLGQVGLLTALTKGKSYVQVAAFANAQDVQKALESMKSYVPVSIYQAAGEKNPWRIVIDSAPKAQMGFLMMSFRAQGYRSAAIVKG